MLGDCGLFFTDAAGLAHEIELTLTDSPLVASLRTKALERAEAHYSWEAVTDAYEKLFRDLVSL